MDRLVPTTDVHYHNRLPSLADKIKSCFLCEELAKSRSRIVIGYGDVRAAALYIGEAPGALGTDITGVPFTRDRSGVFLQKMQSR